MSKKESADQTIKTIRRKTRRQHTAEEKICIMMEGLRGEEGVAEICRREGISQSLYYKWSKKFLETGKSRLSGDVHIPAMPITDSGHVDHAYKLSTPIGHKKVYGVNTLSEPMPFH